jgi:RimJ/RimL family protein N-acetyltransferase
MLIKIDLTNPQNREELYNFYHRHYDAPKHLLPESPESIEGIYYAFTDGVNTLAVTRHSYPTPYLLQTHGTVVHMDYRGQGIGKRIHDSVETMAIENGVTKMSCQVFVDNISSIVLKLKTGYLVEGLLRNHEEKDKDEYIMGKEL